MRKLLVLVILSLICLSGLFALNGLVTWTWFENDPAVEYFRYQVDGEDEANWTVVDWSVNEVTILLDISVPHELHLQQSYDGENWSESSIVESEVFTDADFQQPSEEELWTEEPVEEPTEEGSQEMPAEEAQPQEETQEQQEAEKAETPATPEAPKYLPVRAFDYGIGYLNAIPNSAGPKTIGVFVAYTRTFLKVKDVFDLGFKANASMYSSLDIFNDFSSTRLISYVNVLATATALVGNSDIYLSIGPDVGFNLINDETFKLGLCAEFGVRFHRSPKFSLGFALADHYYLFPTDGRTNRFDVRIFMSSVF